MPPPVFYLSSIEAALTLAAEQCKILISSGFPARGEAQEGRELILFCIIFNLNSISFLFFLQEANNLGGFVLNFLLS